MKIPDKRPETRYGMLLIPHNAGAGNIPGEFSPNYLFRSRFMPKADKIPAKQTKKNVLILSLFLFSRAIQTKARTIFCPGFCLPEKTREILQKRPHQI